ncbi:MAG: hypothetical protein H6Q70_1660 [Firmicutes bacterium]|nr:hypothetical protein [Bacillota bacterium]
MINHISIGTDVSSPIQPIKFKNPVDINKAAITSNLDKQDQASKNTLSKKEFPPGKKFDVLTGIRDWIVMLIDLIKSYYNVIFK